MDRDDHRNCARGGSKVDILNLVGQIVRDLLIFVGACFALLVVLLIVVARLAMQLTAFTQRRSK